jgi:hypothetical protein
MNLMINDGFSSILDLCVMDLIFLIFACSAFHGMSTACRRAQRHGTARSKSNSVVPVPVNEHDGTDRHGTITSRAC